MAVVNPLPIVAAPAIFNPRAWQREAAHACIERAAGGADRALIYACPGAGKTYGGLFIAMKLREVAGKGPLILVITPSLAIKSQWIKRASAMGLDLLEINNPRQMMQNVLPFGTHGYILNYQQAIRMKKVLRAFCDAHAPIVILDEVHHTGLSHKDNEGNVWGESIQHSCASASFKVCTTGTPFREPGTKIAFVVYDEDGGAIPSFSYAYQRAIREGVCRPIVFGFHDGESTWTSKGNGKQVTANFQTKLTKKQSRERLEAAVSLNGDFPKEMFRQAHAKLMEIRSGEGVDATAGGLVVAVNIVHANAIAEYFRREFAIDPVVIHNKVDEAQALIQEFTDGDAPWIIGINMLSEGVDIPRLRVGVYATRIKAELYFHQFCGRFMRVQEHRHERSYIFLPQDPEIEVVAKTIEQERYHALGDDDPVRGRRAGNAGRHRQGLVVEASYSELAYEAFSGHRFPTTYLEKHQAEIDDFRRVTPAWDHAGRAEIALVLVSAGKIPAPGAGE